MNIEYIDYEILFNELSAKYQALRTQLNTLEEAFLRLRKANDVLVPHVDTLTLRSQRLEGQNEDLRFEIDAVRENNTSLRNENEALRTQLEALSTQHKETSMNLIFIGRHFYHESGTRMSTLYTTDGKRSDWAKVEAALQAGSEVHIRPATDEERAPYEQRLEELKAGS